MTQNYKPRILIFCDFYLPGYKSGGGMRTIGIEGPHGRLDADVVTRSMGELPPDTFDRLVPRR